MRKVVILVVLGLCLSVAGALAEAPAAVQPAASPAVVDPAGFLAQLSATLGTPKPENRSACYISRECVCGGGYVTIECWGEVSCMLRPKAVVCDGEYTYCPPIGSCPF